MDCPAPFGPPSPRTTHARTPTGWPRACTRPARCWGEQAPFRILALWVRVLQYHDALSLRSLLLMSTSNTVTDRAQKIVDEFSLFSDWMNLYQYLIEMGDDIPLLPDDMK